MKQVNMLTLPNRGETLWRCITGIILFSMLFGPWMNEFQTNWSRWSNGDATNQALISFLLLKMLFSAVQVSILYLAVFRPMSMHASEQRQSDAFVQEVQAELADLRFQVIAMLRSPDGRHDQTEQRGVADDHQA